jgi:phage shock protein A
MTRSSQDPDPPEHAVDPVDPSSVGGDPTGYVDGVPTFDFVRDRIEGRYATAMGTTELADGSEAGRSLAQQEEDREAAAKARLDEIRKSLHRD